MKVFAPFHQSGTIWVVSLEEVYPHEEDRIFEWLETNVEEQPMTMFFYDLMLVKFKNEMDAIMFFLAMPGGLR